MTDLEPRHLAIQRVAKERRPKTRRAGRCEPASRHQKKFTKRIAFNAIPHIDVFMDDGSTKEEWKMVVETKKILDAGIEVFATCVRIPTFIGHGEAVHVEFEKPITDEQARAALRKGAALNAVQIAEELIKTYLKK